MSLQKILFYFLFLQFSYSYCQGTISGVIVDDKGAILPSASVVLKNEKNQGILAYCISDEKGNYLLKIPESGTFHLNFSALSYETFVSKIEIKDPNSSLKQDATLFYQPFELNEVIIKTERPITVKRDTIIFDVKAFAKGNEMVVEDLLKNIPGLNISSDGVIKVGNQEIEKVMIEGDDFFEKGYKLLTKNMPANPIEKVELYQHYSNNKHLKGIEKSDKVALNLTLKEDSKREWFGNIQAGYGLASENRYEMRGNLMNFGKKNKYYFLTNLNNIGDDATGDIDHLIRPVSLDDIASVGDNKSAHEFIGLQAETPNLKPKRVNFNNAEMISLNSIFTLSSKTKLKTLGFFNSDENNFFRNSYESFFVEGTNFENTEDFVGRKTRIIGFGKINFIHDFSKTKTLEFISKFNSEKQKNRSDLTFNGDLLAEKLNGNNQLFDQKIVFTNKFNTNKVLLFSARYINEKTPQNYSANQFLYQDLFAQDANSIKQVSENKMGFAGFEAHLLDRKKNGDLMEIQISNEFRKDKLFSNFQLKDNGSVVGQPVGYQNDLLYSTNDLFLMAKYRFQFRKLSLLLQTDFHQLFNKLESFEVTRNQSPFYINPKLGLEYEINKKNRISTSYSLNRTNASVLDVYDNYIQTSFRSFSRGTGNFNQLDASAFMFNYTYGGWGDKFFANTFILYTQNHDFFSTNTWVAQNYSQSDKIIIKDRELLTISSNIDKYFKPIYANLKLTLGVSKSNYKNIVNDSDFREIKNTTLNYGFEVRSGFSGFFNYHLGSKWNYTEITTTVSNSFTNNMTFLDLSFVMSDRFNFQIQMERYHFGNLDRDNNKYHFMDLEARYVMKQNKLAFSIAGNNLLNVKTFKNYNINDISISRTEYRLQPRYVLLKMEYRF